MFTICKLREGVCDCQTLDLIIDQEQKVTWIVTGTTSVHLSGSGELLGTADTVDSKRAR